MEKQLFLSELRFSFPHLGQHVQMEEKGQGSVPWSVYGVYIQAAGGPLAFLVILSLFMLNVGSTAFSNWWLSYWIKQGSGVRFLIDGKIVRLIIWPSLHIPWLILGKVL